jgi:hypothetical protein
VREGKEAVGRKLIDVPGYTFRIWVTNRTEGPLELWRDYNGGATIEQRIEELKNDLAADDFCTQNFWATESAFLATLFTFNLFESLPAQRHANGRLPPACHLAGHRVLVRRHPGSRRTPNRVASVRGLGRFGQTQTVA